MKKGTTAFQLVAGHPALDFINTLDNRFVPAGPTEMLNSYADVLAFTHQSALLEGRWIAALTAQKDSTRASRALQTARELRETLAQIFYGALDDRAGPPRRAMEQFKRHVLAAKSRQDLLWTPRSSASDSCAKAAWAWGRSETSPELPVWALALSAAELLTSGDMHHIRTCGSAACRWLFLDMSKNHSRRWCDMKVCGNRTKARAFQARQRK
jgi:predicted RNA-binding Zn ribbon-like protein